MLSTSTGATASQSPFVIRNNFDMSKTDQALVALYQHLRQKTAGDFGNLDAEGRRAYFREAQRKSRARRREVAATGTVPATTPNIRAVLSDAALMILATGGPGAEQIEKVLASVFVDKPGVPMVVRARAARGRLTPIIAKVKP